MTRLKSKIEAFPLRNFLVINFSKTSGKRRGRDGMVFEITTTYAISA